MSRSVGLNGGTREVLELTRMTKKGIQELCKKNKLYHTPALNDVLYLHYQGYRDIESLEEYTGLKCLWLENNAISEIAGLENQKILKCLFLNNNLIKKIENLENCRELDTLNLANNHITRIENCGVDKLPVLTTLILSHNYIRTAEQLEDIVDCRMLSVLDLAHNRIEDILIVKLFAQMPELRVLDLDGNPVVNKIPQYRKTLILECKNLTHLDRKPVFSRDRACAEAWRRGGYEEERREHNRWNKADRRRTRESVNATIRLRNRGGGDSQVELIPSSGDEDDTERSSGPSAEPLPKQQPADSLSIDEDLQYVEYYDPEALPQVEKKREIRKCKICGRVECNYVHTEERRVPQKVLKSPEDILETSHALLEGKQMRIIQPENDSQKVCSDSVNIPNISSTHYESEIEPKEITKKQETRECQNQQTSENFVDAGNKKKDDLFEKAYVNYFDTVDRLLYIESKASADSFAKDSTYNNEELNAYIKPVDNETNLESLNLLHPQHHLINELIDQCMSSSELKLHDSADTSMQKTSHSNGPGLNVVSQRKDNKQQPELEETFLFNPNEINGKDNFVPKNKENNMSGSCVPPPSEKKKVRLVIESENDGNHVKIPTTPIPHRKGRKINWDRMQDKSKRTKLDRENSVEDMLDIYADCIVNPTKFKHSQESVEPCKIPTGEVNGTAIPNILSSTFNESILDTISACGSDFALPKFDKDVISELTIPNDSMGNIIHEVSDDSIENPKSSLEQSTSKGSVGDADDNSNVCNENAERAISSIRQFISSYDAFLQSIEGRAQDLSERCKTSCVPPEYLTEEIEEEEKNVKEDKSEDNVEVKFLDLADGNLLDETLERTPVEHGTTETKLFTIDDLRDTKESEQLSKIRSSIGTNINNHLFLLDKNQETKDNSNGMLYSGDKIKNEIEFSPNCVSMEVNNVASGANEDLQIEFETLQTENSNVDLNSIGIHLKASPKNKEPVRLPEILSSSKHLQGYYTEEGRRNSEIIQQLLENPLTKKVSAEDVCKDFHETTKELLRLNIMKQEQGKKNSKKVVKVAYSQKADYEGSSEFVDSKLVIYKNCSKSKQIIEKDTSSLGKEITEEVTWKKKLMTNETFEDNYRGDILSGVCNGLAEDLRRLFKLDDEDFFPNSKIDFKVKNYKEMYQYERNSVSPDESCKTYSGIGECFEDTIEFVTKTLNESSTDENYYFQNSLSPANDSLGNESVFISKHDLFQLGCASTSMYREQLNESVRFEACQNEDSSEIYHEALSSYVISETNDGPEVFQPAQSDIDEIAEKPTTNCKFNRNNIEADKFDSVSNYDAVLGTTFERSVSSSCWEQNDEKVSENILHVDFQDEELERDEKLQESQNPENNSIEDRSSDNEDSESHPLNACLSYHCGRFTI